MTQRLDHAVEGGRQLADLVLGRDGDAAVEAAGLDLAGALQEAHHRARDAAADQHREYEAEDRGDGGDDAGDDDRPLLRAGHLRRGRADLRQHVGTDAFDPGVEFVAQGVGAERGLSRGREILAVELAEQRLVLGVQAHQEVVDGVVDAVVEPSERGIV